MPLPVVLALGVAIIAIANGALTPDQQKSMLDLHNQARATSVMPSAANMIRLVWDNSLAASAQAYASSCPQGHSSTPYGENLSFGWPVMTPERAVLEWTAEAAAYDYKTNDCINGQVCGHFTQQVWATTTRVGCGHNVCASFGQPVVQTYVCHYDEAGNWWGEMPYAAGPACSLCPSGYGCVGNLCTLLGTTAGAVPATQASIPVAPVTTASVVTAAPVATAAPAVAAPIPTAAPVAAAPIATAAPMVAAPVVIAAPIPIVTVAAPVVIAAPIPIVTVAPTVPPTLAPNTTAPIAPNTTAPIAPNTTAPIAPNTSAPAIFVDPALQVLVFAPLTTTIPATNRPFIKATKLIPIS